VTQIKEAVLTPVTGFSAAMDTKREAENSNLLSDAARNKIIKDLAGSYLPILGVLLFVFLVIALENIFGHSIWNFFGSVIICALIGNVIEDYRSKKLRQYDDQILQIFHSEYQGKRLVVRIAVGILTAFTGIGLIGVYAEKKDNEKKPSCSVSAVEVEPLVYYNNHEADAGYAVRFLVKNNGATGSITTRARLSTSEGDFNSSTQRVVDAGKAGEIRLDFPEPSVNATNVQAYVNCEP
jgi:hypothetical protein